MRQRFGCDNPGHQEGARGGPLERTQVTMLEKLRQLGWGDYEAKAYLALLGHHPATGYRVAKESGVPTAKVYEALARLVERGAIRLHPGAEGEAAQYVPVPPEEVMAGLRARHARMLDELTRELAGQLIEHAGVAGTQPGHDLFWGNGDVLGRLALRAGMQADGSALHQPRQRLIYFGRGHPRLFGDAVAGSRMMAQ